MAQRRSWGVTLGAASACGLLAATLDVLEPTVPEDAAEEREAWAALRAGLLDRIASNADV